MPLSNNGIRRRAVAFAREWKDATNEEAEAMSFGARLKPAQV